MRIKNFTKFLLDCFLILILTCIIFIQTSHADIDVGIGRVRLCRESGAVEDLDYNPFSGGNDVQFVMSNPVCGAVAAASYLDTKISIAVMNSVCGSGDTTPRFTPSPILDAIDIARATVKAGSNRNGSCGIRIAWASSSYLHSISVISAIYGVAVNAFNNSRICGANWIGPNPTQFLNNAPNYKSEVENTIFGKGGYIERKELDKLTLENKTYREWYYGGVEVEDLADGGYCPDVTQEKGPLGFYPPQKYYMKGLETANFNCKKYDILPGQEAKDPKDGTPLTAARLAEYRLAYDCCKKRAREYVCIEYSGQHKFCQTGKLCIIDGITFSAKAIDNGRLACAETYSLCPYNFTLGGGTEKCDFYQDGIKNSETGRYDIIDVASVTSGDCAGKSEIRRADCTYNQRAGRCKNYCQFMTHCTKTDLSNYQYASSITSAYFSNACLNFVGDSQNVISFGTGFIAGSARHFSAPIAQCTKETVENIFYNRAGHTRCKMLTDSPTNNNCPGGTIYKKGEQVMAQSFFSTMQNHMRTIVKMILTLSIVFYGAKILVGGGGIKKSDLLMYVLKIGLVLYFATGEAWQTMFFDGVYSASTVFSQMVFKVQTPADPEKRDGCQFGNVFLDDNTQVSTSHYPAGKEYLAIWDTLDCKITRYLGFGPELSTANIAKLILSGFITGPIGIYFSISLLFFGLLLLAAAIRALQIFLCSAIAIILMVYVSPLVIPLVLFEKTKGIFKGWLSQLISFSLQPMILFAYIAIFVSLMDRTFIGSATFYGEPPSRSVSCRQYCENALGVKVDNPNCDRIGETLVLPKVDSIACMISVNYFANWPGLELIGITLPFLIDFFTDHAREKILTLAKAVLVMYFLCTFMDEIPAIASQLLGGASLPGSKISAEGMFNSIGGALKGVQQRAKRGIKKWGIKGAKGSRDAINEIMEGGDKGKSVQKTEKGEGASEAMSSGSPKSDATGGDGASKSEASPSEGSGSKPVEGASNSSSDA